MFSLSWSVVFSLLALWSLAAWAIHSITAWTVSKAGALTGAASGVEGLRLPEWLAPWAPLEIVPRLTAEGHMWRTGLRRADVCRYSAR